MPLPSLASRLALPAVILSNVLLAFGPLLVRLSRSEALVGPVAAGFWRLTLALPLLLLFAAVSGGSARSVLPPRRHAWALAVGGLFFAADLGSWHAGILHTRLANATLFGNAAAFTFPIYAFVVARRWPHRQQALGLMLALAGTLLLLGRSYELSPKNLLGDGLTFLAGLFYTVYLIAMQRARADMRPLPALAATTAAGIVPILLFAILFGERIWPATWTPLILLAIGSQVIGQTLLAFAVGHLPPLVIGISLLLQPVVGAATGWIAYGERLALADYAGALALCIALVLVRAEPPAPKVA